MAGDGIFDISVALRSGGIVYPGNPEIDITAQQRISRGATANVSTIRFGSHTGTHVDAAKHFDDAGAGADEIPLARLIGPALLVAVADDVKVIDAAELEKHAIDGHQRVLFRTRNSRLLNAKAFTSDYTYIAPDAAAQLVEKGVQLVGVDYLSIEQFRSGHHRTHRTLLSAGVVIVEGLDLSEPAPGQYQFVCLPLRLVGLDGAPARAVLMKTRSLET